MSDNKPLQDRLHPDAAIRSCYGCGANNSMGLGIKSFLDGDEAVCRWQPKQHHCSYPGYLNGGIACTLIDCHSAWTAFAFACREEGIGIDRPDPPSGWTRAMNVEFLKPVPLGGYVELRATVVKKGRTSRSVACSLYADGNECVKAEVTIVMAGFQR